MVGSPWGLKGAQLGPTQAPSTQVTHLTRTSLNSLACNFGPEPADTLSAENHLLAHGHPSVGLGWPLCCTRASDSPRNVQPTPPRKILDPPAPSPKLSLGP